MLINLQVAKVASKRDYLGCLACLEESFGRLGCLEEMPSGGGFEGDYFGHLGCLEMVPSDGEFA